MEDEPVRVPRATAGQCTGERTAGNPRERVQGSRVDDEPHEQWQGHGVQAVRYDTKGALEVSNEIMFRAGLLGGVVCAPKRMKRAAVLRAVNSEHPSGTSNGWSFSRRRKLEDGTKLPAPCLDEKGRVHYLLEC